MIIITERKRISSAFTEYLQDMMKQVNYIYESILDKIMEPETFKVPGCESMIKDIDVSGLVDVID